DVAKRAEYAAAAQDWILNDAVLTVPIYSPAQVVGAASTVHGIEFDAHSRNLFYDAWVEQD
ncbi:MAG: ABC transporter substrate-binding protein, partial [Mycetocola sp.]